MSKLKLNLFKGFTLAEILVAIAIIGIVAALTLPSLFANIELKRRQTKFKKDFALINGAVKMANAKYDLQVKDFVGCTEPSSDKLEEGKQSACAVFNSNIKGLEFLGNVRFDSGDASAVIKGGQSYRVKVDSKKLKVEKAGKLMWVYRMLDGSLLIFPTFQDYTEYSRVGFVDTNGLSGKNTLTNCRTSSVVIFESQGQCAEDPNKNDIYPFIFDREKIKFCLMDRYQEV